MRLTDRLYQEVTARRAKGLKPNTGVTVTVYLEMVPGYPESRIIHEIRKFGVEEAALKWGSEQPAKVGRLSTAKVIVIYG